MPIRYFSFLICFLILTSCKLNISEHRSQKNDSTPRNQTVLDDAKKFAEEVLGDRLRIYFTPYKRGEIGVDALFESQDLIGYTTYSNEFYQKVPSPRELKDCILFAAEYKNPESAEKGFKFLKSNSKISPSEVEGMVGPTPVQVRTLEKIRNDGGGIITRYGNYVFFLPEIGDEPQIGKDWKEYENLFLSTIAGNDDALGIIRLAKK